MLATTRVLIRGVVEAPLSICSGLRRYPSQNHFASVPLQPPALHRAALWGNARACVTHPTEVPFAVAQAGDNSDSAGLDELMSLMVNDLGSTASPASLNDAAAKVVVPQAAPRGGQGSRESPSGGSVPDWNHGKTTRRNRVLQLHGMPRFWMHEDIVHFIEAVADSFGIPSPDGVSWAPHSEDDADRALPMARSAFIRRLRVPFGRRTGLVYGSPEVEVTCEALADALLGRLLFDADDYRARISFTEVAEEELRRRRSLRRAKRARLREIKRRLTDAGAAGISDAAASQNAQADDVDDNDDDDDDDDASESLSEEEELQAEQQFALETLELDRYLLAPDLLYDLAKMQQRRLVTANGRVLLETFRDSDPDDQGDALTDHRDDRGDDRSGGPSESEHLRRKPRQRVRDNAELGRGSPQNSRIPRPYVQGRSGF